jgi:hypothetical protein
VALTCRGSVDAQKTKSRLKDELFNTLLVLCLINNFKNKAIFFTMKSSRIMEVTHGQRTTKTGCCASGS